VTVSQINATGEPAALTTELSDRKSQFDERIAHQTAILDVLRAMSDSPGDPQPVFDLITERAVRSRLKGVRIGQAR